MSDHSPPDNPPPDWPTNEDGDPVPANANGDPCGLCMRKDRACPHADPDYDHTESGAGRPTRLNPDLCNRIITLVREGKRIGDVWAHEDVNVPERTYHGWIQRGIQHQEEGKDTIFADLSQGIARATTRVVMEADEDMKEAAESGDAKKLNALMDYWKRRVPDRYSTKRIQEHQGPDGEAAEFQIQLTNPDDENGEEEEVEA